jgi:hypothetical protein
MGSQGKRIDVYLETGKKKTFGGAIEWPGWSRSGRDESGALQALLEAGPRYARVLKAAGIDFKPPEDISAFEIVERLPGTSTTDFGAPDAAPQADEGPVDEERLRFFGSVLKASWSAFEAAVRSAQGKELAKGPRGGGREVDGIVRHVLGAEAGYLSRLGGKFKVDESRDPVEELRRARETVLETLGQAAGGEIPATGPRGGQRWSPGYFARRSAWHILDHAWEIEDRMI